MVPGLRLAIAPKAPVRIRFTGQVSHSKNKASLQLRFLAGPGADHLISKATVQVPVARQCTPVHVELPPYTPEQPGATEWFGVELSTPTGAATLNAAPDSEPIPFATLTITELE